MAFMTFGDFIILRLFEAGIGIALSVLLALAVGFFLWLNRD